MIDQAMDRLNHRIMSAAITTPKIHLRRMGIVLGQHSGRADREPEERHTTTALRLSWPHLL
jgi:hypothetical protein